jgi:hypothetical protein
MALMAAEASIARNHRLRGGAAHPRIPVRQEMARYAGFHWHFAKPANPDFIADVVQNPQRRPAETADGTPLNPVH